MKRTLLLLSIVTCVLAARADLLIQHSTQTMRLTGENRERTLRFSGWILQDLDGTNGASIRTIIVGGRKFYEVNRDSIPVFSATVPGANGRQFRVISHGNMETNELSAVKVDGLLVKGVNADLQVSETRHITYPRVLRGIAHRLDFDSGNYRVLENAVTRIYSQTETRTANTRGEDVEAALARIIQRIEAAGYRLP